MNTYGTIKPVDYLYTHRDYDWSVVGVWKGPLGYYLGTDSGCSCYSPWEHYESGGDLTGPLTAEQVHEEVTSLADTNSYLGAEPEEVIEFLAQIK